MLHTLKLACMLKGKLYIQYTCMESDLTDNLRESINCGNVKSLSIEKVWLVRGQQSMTGNHSWHNISKHGEVVWLDHLSIKGGRGGEHAFFLNLALYIWNTFALSITSSNRFKASLRQKRVFTTWRIIANNQKIEWKNNPIWAAGMQSKGFIHRNI